MPLVCPVDPGVQPLPQGTQHQIAQARIIYDNNHCQFHKANLIEHIILQQIINTINADYIQENIDNVTYVLSGTVTDIIQYLFNTYSQISPEELTTMKADLLNMTFDTTMASIQSSHDLFVLLLWAVLIASCAIWLFLIDFVFITTATPAYNWGGCSIQFVNE